MTITDTLEGTVFANAALQYRQYRRNLDGSWATRVDLMWPWRTINLILVPTDVIRACVDRIAKGGGL